MNVINFQDRSCERIQKYLDAYLSNELSVETSLEVLNHLDRCPRCTEELAARQQVKEALNRVLARQDPAPPHLRQKILKEIRPKSSRKYWWAAAAAALLLIGNLQLIRWLNSRQITESASRTSPNHLVSAHNAELLKIGIDDHIHCALSRNFSEGPRSSERMAREMETEYAELVPIVKDRVSPDYIIMVAHHCEFKGRNYVHLILTGQKAILSIVFTRKKSGESFDRSDLTPISNTSLTASGTSLYRSRLQDQNAIGFESRDHLAYVVSNLPEEDHFKLASSLAPSLKSFLSQLEG